MERTRFALLLYGFLNNKSGVGASVPRARAPIVSIIRLTWERIIMNNNIMMNKNDKYK